MPNKRFNDNEGEMIAEIWKYLGGDVKGHITLNNLRMFLLAIMGTFVEPTLNRDTQQL